MYTIREENKTVLVRRILGINFTEPFTAKELRAALSEMPDDAEFVEVEHGDGYGTFVFRQEVATS